MKDEIRKAFVTPKWISVKDRLPEIGEDVLCGCQYDKDDFEMAVGYFYRNKWKVAEDIITAKECYGEFRGIEFDSAVTHWMPLPKPPNPMTGGGLSEV